MEGWRARVRGEMKEEIVRGVGSMRRRERYSRRKGEGALPLLLWMVLFDVGVGKSYGRT